MFGRTQDSRRARNRRGPFAGARHFGLNTFRKKNSLIPLAGIFDLLPIFVTMIQLPSHPDHIIHASSVKLELKLEWILNITETLIGYELQSLTFHPS